MNESPERRQANGNIVRLPGWVVVWASTLLLALFGAWLTQDRRLSAIEGRLANLEYRLDQVARPGK